MSNRIAKKTTDSYLEKGPSKEQAEQLILKPVKSVSKKELQNILKTYKFIRTF